MRHARWIGALLFLATGATVNAQTTNCISLGGGMVHCDSTSGASTDCMAMGETMATCNTIGGRAGASSQDGGAALGSGLVDLVRSIQERSFKKKLGAKLAAGDCEGAAKFALDKGRLELGAAISSACASHSTPGHSQAQSVDGVVAGLAQQARPHRINDGLFMQSARANGSQLIITFLADGPQLPDIEEQRAGFVSESCSDKDMRSLYEAGATFRANYIGKDGGSIGTFLITAGDCGVR